MTDDDALAYLRKELDSALDRSEDKQRFFRDSLLAFTIGTASLTALTTVLIGLSKFFWSDILSSIALVTSASLSVIAAWDAYFSTSLDFHGAEFP